MNNILGSGRRQATQKQNGADQPEYRRNLFRLRLNVSVLDQVLPKVWIQACRQNECQPDAILAKGSNPHLYINLKLGRAFRRPFLLQFY